MGSVGPRISICIPHWQVEQYAKPCLRSIRQHSRDYDLEVIVIDNGSKDGSLDYLRSLDWIHLIERPEETSDNWPKNVFTAWDHGLKVATGEFYVTMHSDVFVRRDRWLDNMLAVFDRNERIAASGAWKLELEHPLYLWQKRVVGFATNRIKSALGLKTAESWKQKQYPRDYCAMYRTKTLRSHGLSFHCDGMKGGGFAIAKQIWDAGFDTGLVPVRTMADDVFHVAHGTAALRPEKPLNHRRAQKKVENKVSDLFAEPWIQHLVNESSLDASYRNDCAA